MGKRRGNVVTADELVEAIGVDASRFFLVQRSHDQTMDIDLDLAVRQERENPVYYVQYAHARAQSILRRAAGEGHGPTAGPWTHAPEPQERELVKRLVEWPVGGPGGGRAPRTAPRRRLRARRWQPTSTSSTTICGVLHDDADIRAFRLTLTAAVGSTVRRVARPDRRHGPRHDVTVATLGDLVLDVSTRPHGPIAPDTDTPSANRLEAGGQAANVAAWVAASGGMARLVTRRSDDPAGRMAEERVRARGVEVVGPLGPEPAGIIVSLVGADGTRSMLTDRGAGPMLAAADLRPDWFDGVRWLHVSGYALTAEPVLGAALAAAARVRAQGGRVSVDLASVAAIEAAGPRQFLRRVADCQPALVFGTQAELVYDALPAPLVVAKRGAGGASLRGTVEIDRPARAAEVIDPTGAGDALAGGMLAALAAGASAPTALDAGLEAAARCIGRRAAMPPLR